MILFNSNIYSQYQNMCKEEKNGIKSLNVVKKYKLSHLPEKPIVWVTTHTSTLNLRVSCHSLNIIKIL